jgi:hypothetical protein
MYGIVNQAIQGLVVENFGQSKWEMIKRRSGVDNDYFISNEPYDDDITYELVAAASEILEITAEEVLRAFGEYWVLKTGYEKYGDLMKAGGENFFEFMCNLPNFHGRIMLIYPNLNPPEFMVEQKGENELILHYYSTRQGLTEFVAGLINGLAKMFSESIEIKLLKSEQTEVWHDTFFIRIIK